VHYPSHLSLRNFMHIYYIARQHLSNMLHPILNLLVAFRPHFQTTFMVVFSLFAAWTKPMMTCDSSNCFNMDKSKLDHVRISYHNDTSCWIRSKNWSLFINLGHEVPLNSIDQLLPGRIRTCILFSKCSQLEQWNWKFTVDSTAGP
jgi:hypothetical protein